MAFCFHWRDCQSCLGELRTTQDVDITLFTSFGREREFSEELLAQYESRVADPVEVAISSRVLLLKSGGGIPIDIALAAFPHEEMLVNRRVAVDFGMATPLQVITAEDLIVMKVFAGREQDWADVVGVIKRQASNLDWDYISTHVRDFGQIKEDPLMLGHLERLRQQYSE